MIEISQASKTFNQGQSWAVRNIHLEVQSGEWLVLLGASGSGKSTLLKMINRLVDDFEGTIRINGKDVSKWDPPLLRRSMGYVFQGIGLFPHWTVEENIMAGLKLVGQPLPRQKKRASELLDLMQMPSSIYASRFPSQLSGGERQRVGVARALATDPEYLLMDEPFGSLDGVTRDTLQKQMLALKSQLKKTVVFVTHDLFEAITLADRIGVMNQGILEQIDSPAKLRHQPATPFVRDLFQKPLEQLALLEKT